MRPLPDHLGDDFAFGFFVGQKQELPGCDRCRQADHTTFLKHQHGCRGLAKEFAFPRTRGASRARACNPYPYFAGYRVDFGKRFGLQRNVRMFIGFRVGRVGRTAACVQLDRAGSLGRRDLLVFSFLMRPDRELFRHSIRGRRGSRDGRRRGVVCGRQICCPLYAGRARGHSPRKEISRLGPLPRNGATRQAYYAFIPLSPLAIVPTY